MNVVAINSKLSYIKPLHVVCIEREQPALSGLFDEICKKYHYLEHREPAGDKLRYIVYTDDNRVVACLMFSHAAWNLPDRESFIGWKQDVKKHNLKFLVNNSRFAIMPEVRVKNLATWILGKVVRRISNDWFCQFGILVLAWISLKELYFLFDGTSTKKDMHDDKNANVR